MRDEAIQRLAAILCADVEGYCRLMSEDESATLRALDWHRRTSDRLIAQWGGRIANTAGDSIVAEFPSMARALPCALDVQEHIALQNQDATPNRHVQFRIGLHVGEVHSRGEDLLGDGVNIAARVQSLAPAGSVWLSDVGYFFGGKVNGIRFEDMGVHELKNIPAPMRIWQAAMTEELIRPTIPSLHKRAIFHLARRFQTVCDRVLAKITAREGLLPQEYAVLASLDDAPNLTPQQLGVRIGVPPETALEMIEVLSARGLVEAHSQSGLSVVRLSPSGSASRDKLKPVIARAMEAVVAPV